MDDFTPEHDDQKGIIKIAIAIVILVIVMIIGILLRVNS